MKRYLLSLYLLVLAFPSFAGYAQLKPPVGWSPPAGSVGQVAGFNYGAAANAATFKGGTVMTNASLSVGGQLVTMPIGMRVAVNAATIAASAMTLNPLGLAVAGISWLASQCIAYQGGTFVNTCGSTPPSSGLEYMTNDFSNGVYSPTREAACTRALTFLPSTFSLVSCDSAGFVAKNSSQTVSTSIYSRNSACPSGTYVTPGGCSTTPQPVKMTPDEVVKKMAPIAMPDGLPLELPGVTFPVELPVFNPDPAVAPQPSPAPFLVPRPLWLPTGDPVKNPNSDPANKPDTWTQPGVQVNPSPTVTDPWRVDVLIEPKTKTDSSPNVTTTPTSTPTPSEVVTCGLPGKPKCQIDETGTPTYDPKKFELDRPTLDAASKTQRETVSSTTDKATLFTPWATFFTLPPLAACTPITMPVYAGAQIASLNVCPAAEWLRGLMGFVWAAVGFFFVFRTVQDAI